MASGRFLSQIFQKCQPKSQGKNHVKTVFLFWLINTPNTVLRIGLRQCSETPQKPFKVNVKSRPSTWHIEKTLVKKK